MSMYGVYFLIQDLRFEMLIRDAEYTVGSVFEAAVQVVRDLDFFEFGERTLNCLSSKRALCGVRRGARGSVYFEAIFMYFFLLGVY